MASDTTLVVSNPAQLGNARTRRDFLRIMGIGGAVVLLPSVLSSCNDDDILGPGSGNAVVIDFAKGDVAVLQFAFALEQLEADFYTRVVAAFGGSNLTPAEQSVMSDIKNHEVIHREFLKIALGANGNFALTPTYPGVDFSSRTSVLATARTFEDLGVSAYNGAAQYLTSTTNLLVAGKIVSVEARHAAAIRDLIDPKSGHFAPTAFDDAFRPAKVRDAAQGFIVDRIDFANAPTAFVQGPNNNG
ncbi:MAG: ferritin-like domain-containing protein [Gemmatimonadaceae bacterium]